MRGSEGKKEGTAMKKSQITMRIPSEADEVNGTPEAEWTEQIRLKKLRPKNPAERVKAFRAIVAEHQAMMIDGTFIDATSAHAWVQVYDKLKDPGKAKLSGLTARQGVKLVWKVVS